MATTSNFGWETPDDTDLVKDGALAIRTLGNNIDTSLVDLKGGTTGQILSKNSNTDLDYTWINNDQGDITEVQAGTGISVASGTGPVPVITNTVATEFDAKGDLVVGTGADTFDKLTVGTNEYRLVADSAQTTGLKYVADTTNYAIAAKGDILAGTAADTVAPLTLGTNDQVLTVDTSTATGLKWAAAAAGGDTFAAGKNKIINGAFDWNQRAFTSITTNQGYGFDRWILQHNNVGTITYSAETFSPGTAPVAGYEAKNFARVATTGQTGSSAFAVVSQRIESVRTLANRTATISFWAKAGSGTPSISVELQQIFGTGGSPSSAVQTLFAKQAITTTWTRYSFTATVPSISGKTIGTTNDGYLELNLWTSAGSTYNTRTNSLGNQDATIDFWGVQIEAGSTATDFQTATGTLAGELAACQRYYFRSSGGGNYMVFGHGIVETATVFDWQLVLPTRMRITPTSVDFANIGVQEVKNGTIRAISAVTLESVTSGPYIANFNCTAATGLTANRICRVLGDNNSGAYVGVSAEL